jgi:alpha-tubulin suppressor-like RCC1 family protein
MDQIRISKTVYGANQTKSYTGGIKLETKTTAITTIKQEVKLRKIKGANWTDIVAISAGIQHFAGLKSDGIVVAFGKNNKGQCKVSDWKGIKSESLVFSIFTIE